MHLTVNQQPSYVYTGGKAPAPGHPAAIVFIHGAQQDHSCWALQSRWFAHHGYTALVPDLPGHGRSGGTPLATVEALAEWIVALLDAAGIAKATLVGHSLGALVVIETALRHTARVDKAVLIAPALPMPVSAALLDAAADDPARAIAQINERSYSPRGQLGGNSAPGLWMLGINQRLMARQPAGTLLADLSACHAYARPIASLAVLSAPTLILGATHDRMVSPQAAQQLAAALPHAQLLTLAGGHALPAEQPDALLDALQAFVAGPGHG